MQKEILIAVDDSSHSRCAVEYAASMADVISELEFTLLHVQPPISSYVTEEAEKNPQTRAKLNQIIKRNQAAAEIVLDRYQKVMLAVGIPASRIKTVSRPRMHGIAKDVLAYGLLGSFDAIITGRRGLSKMQEVVMGSVTSKLIEHSEVTPVWVVNDNQAQHNILMAVDGSEGALRAVDHVAFMLKDNAAITVTLLHVKPRIGDTHVIEFDTSDDDLSEIILEGERRRVKNFFGHAREMFRKHGIRENQLNVLEVNCTANIGKTVVNEARKGGFGTIVVGRTGLNASFFFGSVSRYVLNADTNAAVWLVP